MHIRSAVFVSVLLACAVSAFGIPSQLGIDFRSQEFSLIAGQAFITPVAGFEFLNINPPPEAPWTWSSQFGIGMVAGPQLVTNPDDFPPGVTEPFYVTEPEEFEIVSWPSFSTSFAGITGIWLDNMKGSVTVDAFDSKRVTVEPDSNGEAFVPLQDSFGGVLSGANGSYSVAGFSKVPDGGATIALLGMGLLGLSALRMRPSARVARINI
jgi:hypothetical protein